LLSLLRPSAQGDVIEITSPSRVPGPVHLVLVRRIAQ